MKPSKRMRTASQQNSRPGVFYPSLLMLLAIASQPAIADGPLQRISDMGDLGTASTHVALNPQIAHYPAEKELMIFWEGTEAPDANEQRRIYGQRIDALTGLELGANDALIAEVSGLASVNKDATRPAVAYNTTDQEYLLTFVGQPTSGSSETEVYGQRVNANTGVRIGAEFLISDCGDPGITSADVSASIGTPQHVTYNPTDNQYLVVWRCDDVDDDDIVNGEFEIFGRIVDHDGTLAGSGDFQISQTAGANGSNTEYDAESPKVAYDSTNNRYLVVWGADNPLLGNGNREIHGQCLTSTGAEFGANDFQLSATAHAGDRDSAVADVVFNPATNQYLVVWAGDNINDGVNDIFGQLVDGSCTTLVGANFPISSTGSASEPRVAHDSTLNQFMVSWHASINGEAELYRQMLDGAATEIGTDIRVTNLGPDGNTGFGPGDATHGIAYVAGSDGCYFITVASDDHQGDQVQDEEEIFAKRIGNEASCSSLQMTVTENQSSAINLRPELSYSLAAIGDNDNSLFFITPDTGEIVFNTDPDFEMPADANGDNVYEIDVLVTDANGNMVTLRISITVTDGPELCSAHLLTRYVKDSQWHMLHLPCQPPTNPAFQFSQLFVDPLEDDQWAAFYYDANSSEPGYVPIAATDPVPDQGFWFATLEPVTLMLPANSTSRNPTDVIFCQLGQCFLQTVHEESSWNMLGSPLDTNFRYSDIKLTNESTLCQDNAPCSLDDATSQHQIDSALFVYNGFSGSYRRLSDDSQGQKVARPWDGYWLKIETEATIDHPWQLYLQRYPSQFMFVTDNAYQGSFSVFDQNGTGDGIVGADMICQSEAMKAGLPGTYKAYLSTADTSPSTTFSQLDTPYIRPDGALFADGFGEFLSGDAGIAYGVDMATTATLARLEVHTFAWSATDNADVYLNGLHTCNSWTSNSMHLGAIGVATNPANWEHGVSSTQVCSSEYHLYCTQQ